MKKITQEDVDKAWGKAWDARDKAWKLEKKIKKQEGLE